MKLGLILAFVVLLASTNVLAQRGERTRERKNRTRTDQVFGDQSNDGTKPITIVREETKPVAIIHDSNKPVTVVGDGASKPITFEHDADKPIKILDHNSEPIKVLDTSRPFDSEEGRRHRPTDNDETREKNRLRTGKLDGDQQDREDGRRDRGNNRFNDKDSDREEGRADRENDRSNGKNKDRRPDRENDRFDRKNKDRQPHDRFNDQDDDEITENQDRTPSNNADNGDRFDRRPEEKNKERFDRRPEDHEDERADRKPQRPNEESRFNGKRPDSKNPSIDEDRERRPVTDTIDSSLYTLFYNYRLAGSLKSMCMSVETLFS